MRLGSDEFTEWVAYSQLEPFGELRGDYRSGVVAATLANVHRAKDGRAFTPEDFMPFMERPESEAAREAQASISPQAAVDHNVARFKALFAHKVKKASQVNQAEGAQEAPPT